jgi:hypothetical protein
VAKCEGWRTLPHQIQLLGWPGIGRSTFFNQYSRGWVT